MLNRKIKQQLQNKYNNKTDTINNIRSIKNKPDRVAAKRIRASNNSQGKKIINLIKIK